MIHFSTCSKLLAGALLAGITAGSASASLIVHYEFNDTGTFLEDSAGTRDLSIVDGDGKIIRRSVEDQ